MLGNLRDSHISYQFTFYKKNGKQIKFCTAGNAVGLIMFYSMI